LNNGDLKLINKGNDTIVEGDYFIGYYYDPAYGFFQTDASSDPNAFVRISTPDSTKCPSATFD